MSTALSGSSRVLDKLGIPVTHELACQRIPAPSTVATCSRHHAPGSLCTPPLSLTADTRNQIWVSGATPNGTLALFIPASFAEATIWSQAAESGHTTDWQQVVIR